MARLVRVSLGMPILVLGLVALAAAACSDVMPSGLPGLRLASGPLVTVETRGGECFPAPCGSTVVIERDGRVHSAAKPPNDLGIAPADVLAALGAAIKTTDFALLKGRPFTGECPTAFAAVGS